MNNLDLLQRRLRGLDYAAFLIPSTDEYLSEFAQPFARRLRWVTGFGGSTGLGIVSRNHAGLFVDGRYQAQGKRDTEAAQIEVRDAGESSLQGWLFSNLRPGDQLAYDAQLHSYVDIERIMRLTATLGIKVVQATTNPVDELWGEGRPLEPESLIVDYPVHYAGLSAAKKCADLREWLTLNGLDSYLVTDPEDVAWLLNVRIVDGLSGSPNSWHVVPAPLSRALVEASGRVLWFVERERLDAALSARLENDVEILAPGTFQSVLDERVRGKRVAANLRRTPYRFAHSATRVGNLRDDAVVARRRWKKHPIEIERAREGHYLDAQAVIRFMAWVRNAVLERPVTELDAAQKLSALRSEATSYKGCSMPAMSASGPSGALAHYIPSKETNRTLNDHPIYWMDSGAQYFGCSTDNTVCMAIGSPEPVHVRAHTLVVKGFIALARARFPVGTYSTQLDSLARQFLWDAGMDYKHGTGHGVGNFLNIHEGPYIGSRIDHPLVAVLEAGMIVSNEPGYYAEGQFGIRIESHLVVVHSKLDGFLEFDTLSRLPIDPRLIDEALLTVSEKQWLRDYHVAIARAYNNSFDRETAAWLDEVVNRYLALVPD